MAGYKRSAHTNTHTPQHPSQEWRGTSEARTQTHTHPNTPSRSGGAQPKPEPKHGHPHRTPQPGVAAYKRSMHTNTHTPQHPGQEWRSAAETRAQAHTPTPHTPARSGGLQAEHAHKDTHTQTPQPGVAGRSRNPSRNTDTHTAHPSQGWRRTSGARTQTHTHPNTPARSGGAQQKPEPKHTHPHRTPQPGVAGCKRSTHTNTHTPQHPSQQWRGAAYKTWGIAMSESMLVAHFSFTHSCRFLCAISGVNYYAISAFDSNPRFRSQKIIPTADFSFVFAFLMLHCFFSLLRLASICSNIIWISDSSIGCCCVCARAVFGCAVMQASQSNTLPVGANSVRSIPLRIWIQIRS